eukprot:GCRY01000594.1.p1 GENE.GCRY01000594.1~~GCRY01000594.1.p1  ORF type:complete len:1213 (-),score=426.64 GCRY01000594.1:225-3863(-)
MLRMSSLLKASQKVFQPLLKSQPAVASFANKFVAMDGNTAAAHVAYACSENAILYPITPSSPLGETCDEWAAQGRKNIFGQVPQIVQMQSEAGVAGAMHGSLVAGGLTTTFTTSQGMLLFLPNMIKIAGELLPSVFHVPTRCVQNQGGTMFGDHADVMQTRGAGFALLSAATVQEAMDMAAIAHMSTLKASVPFVNFYEGFAVSHEVNTVQPLPYEMISDMIDREAIHAHRKRAMNPQHPTIRGCAQSQDVYMQMVEGQNPVFNAVPGIVEQSMRDFEKMTGRSYKLFEYYGAPDAEHVVVIMGCGGMPAQSAVDKLRSEGKKVGVLRTRLYRPFSEEHFLSVLPSTVKKIAVLDRHKEPGALADPLELDISTTILQNGVSAKVVGGRYGLGGKEFTPGMVTSVFANLEKDEPMRKFSVGIIDDVNHTSLPLVPEFNALPKDTTECLFWGYSSDGTIGANKSAIKLIVEQAGLHGQGNFFYDPHKSGGVTTSHLRFGPEHINAPYTTKHQDYVACHKAAYVKTYGRTLVRDLKEGGTFVLNAPWTTQEEIDANLPDELKRALALKKAKVFVIDAVDIALQSGLQATQVNNVMQSVFFHLSKVLPSEKALDLLKKSIAKDFAKKGDAVIHANQKAVDNSISGLVEISVPEDWKDLPPTALETRHGWGHAKVPDFVESVMEPYVHLRGNDMPVSVFPIRGVLEPATSQFEKRAVAERIPRWDADKCIMCNECAMMCSHAAIRPFVVSPEEEAAGRESGELKDHFVTKKMRKTKNKFRIQVSPYDCTGCTLCSVTCPEGALTMTPIGDELPRQESHWSYLTSLPHREGPTGSVTGKERFTVKGSQFHQPMLEFHGSCGGCAQPMYVRVLTQLFGEQLMISNATGCSMIWSAFFPYNPYTTNAKGQGPAWAHSLFEDAAEFGFGMLKATRQRRAGLLDTVHAAITTSAVDGEVKSTLGEWAAHFDDTAKTLELSDKLNQLLPSTSTNPIVQDIISQKDMLPKQTQWIVGGDGWAYDIGYGGLDHILNSGENINILILDNEVYSNTGGQMSKSTPRGSMAKFSAKGKATSKKPLPFMAMAQDNVYVASVAIGADKPQLLRAFKEAEEYPGTSIVFAYTPCIGHGIKGGLSNAVEEMREAVNCGYWNLYRYDPRRSDNGENPLQLDSKADITRLPKFLMGENRYAALKKLFPEDAEVKHTELAKDLEKRIRKLEKMAQ